MAEILYRRHCFPSVIIQHDYRGGVLASADYRAGAQVLARKGLVQRG
jgi:hypothetical protein